MRAVEAIETVGLIQDAAIDAALWPSAVEHMMRQLDGIAGGLVVSDRCGGLTLAAIGFDQSYVARYFDHYMRFDPMLQAQPLPDLGRAAISSTLLPAGAFLKSEFFNDWLAPQGFRDCFSAVVHRQGERHARLHIVPRRCADDSLARAMAMFKPFFRPSSVRCAWPSAWSCCTIGRQRCRPRFPPPRPRSCCSTSAHTWCSPIRRRKHCWRRARLCV
ncbi:hypothetical protein [Vineibacter terrae]|nr:hypothetical protein [Vineibacter terrae]